MPLAGLDPALPTIERPQTYALDRTASGPTPSSLPFIMIVAFALHNLS